jgi:hypothetical protein
MEKKLNRRERRAQQFGHHQPEHHAAGLLSAAKKLNPETDVTATELFERLARRTVKEVNGIIVIPSFNEQKIYESEVQYMIPYAELDDKYKSSSSYHLHNVTEGSTPAHYHRLLMDWFYTGLIRIDFVFKSNVELPTGEKNQQALRKALLRYVGRILQSFEPRHEHKFAYLIYVLDTLCESASWERCDSKEN